jgi:hypothetical protein
MEPADDSFRVLTTTLPRRAVALAVPRRLVDEELVACAQMGVDRGACRALSGEEPG